MIDYIVLDLETTNKNKGEDAIGDFSAAPWHPDNGIVLMGTGNDGTVVTYTWIPNNFSQIYSHIYESSCPVLVGHNIKFDLHYLMQQDQPFYEDIFPQLRIWDTQLAEYLLTAQQSKWASLDDLAVKYGGTLKDGRVKDFWDSGVDTEDIPRDILAEYCMSDIRNTEIVFLGQLAKAQELGMYNLIRTQMEALLATTEMEYNGMYFNKETAQKEEEALSITLKDVKDRIERAMEIRLGIPLVNADSKDQLSLALFGGELKYKDTETLMDQDGNPVLYKSGDKKGLPKTRVCEKTRRILGMVSAANPKWELKKKGFYSTTEEVLREILTKLPSFSFVKDLLEYRQLAKDVGTYYKGYMKLVWPMGFIQGKLNHCQTNTGRLSSSQPNLQNLSGED